MGTDQSYALLNRLVDSQAFMLSANDIFYVSGLIFLGTDAAGVAGTPGARPRRGRGGRRSALRRCQRGAGSTRAARSSFGGSNATSSPWPGRTAARKLTSATPILRSRNPRPLGLPERQVASSLPRCG